MGLGLEYVLGVDFSYYTKSELKLTVLQSFLLE